jgi:hypothetical protein
MKSEVDNIRESLGRYYASHASAVLSHHSRNIEFGTAIAEHKDRLIIIDGEIKKEHLYLIPKIRIHHYGDNRVYFNIPENLLSEFEF